MRALQILLSLYTVALLCSTGAMETIGWILAVSSLFLLVRDRPRKVSWKLGGEWIFAGLLISAVLSAFVNSAPDANFRMMVGKFRWIPYLYLMSYLFRRLYRPEWQKWFKVLLTLSLIVSGYAILQNFQGYDWVRGKELPVEMHGDVSYFRSQGFFSLPLTYAYSLGMLLCLSFGLLVSGWLRSWVGRLFFSLVTLLLAASVVLTFTRGAWIALVLAVGAMLYFVNRKLIVASLVFVVLLGGYGYSTSPMFRQRIHSVITVFDGQANGENKRLTVWAGNLEIVKRYPVFGIGYEENTRRLREFYDLMGLPKYLIDEHGSKDPLFEGHAHNTYLHYLAGNGLIGFFFFMAFVLYFLRWNWQLIQVLPRDQKFHRGLALGAFGAQIHLHIGGLSECNFKDVEVNHMFLFVLCIVTVLAHENLKSARSS